MVDNSSVSIFVNKKSTSENPNRQININMNAKEVEDMCTSVIYNTVISLSNVLTEIRHLVSLTFDTGNKLQANLRSKMI